jgi:Zn-dependent protease
MNNIIQNVAVFALPVLFAITLHEAARAYAARYLGDATAYLQGRMTLNPLKHIDIFGTVILPLVLAMVPGAPIIGYAKPIPMDIGALRKPKRDIALVAGAGLAANLVMAIGWAILALLLTAAAVEEDYFLQVARAGVLTNLLFFAFNLFPIPPLPGGQIMVGILPHRMAWRFAQIEPYGFYIVLGLAALKMLNFWITPIVVGGIWVVQLILSPLTFLLS